MHVVQREISDGDDTFGAGGVGIAGKLRLDHDLLGRRDAIGVNCGENCDLRLTMASVIGPSSWCRTDEADALARGVERLCATYRQPVVRTVEVQHVSRLGGARACARG